MENLYIEQVTASIESVAASLLALSNAVVDEAQSASVLSPRAAASASCDNLQAYLALRRRDIGDLQVALAELGLSSLGRLESNVVESLGRVLDRLGQPLDRRDLSAVSSTDAAALLEQRTRILLGRPREGRADRIMVTLDSTTVADSTRVQQLLRAGMDIARINCAHESEREWLAIIRAVREAEATLEERGEGVGRKCRISMDLAGPKLRTGQFPIVQSTRKLRVDADGGADGLLIFDPGLVPSGRAHTASFAVHVSGLEQNTCGIGAVLDFRDAEGKERAFHVTGSEPGCLSVSLDQSAVIKTGLPMHLGKAVVAIFADVTEELELKVAAGDMVRIPLSLSSGTTQFPLTCAQPETLQFVDVGHRVFIDDGRITGVVLEKTNESLLIEIRAPAGKALKLRPGKGLNFPDSSIDLPAVSDRDRASLAFVAEHADLVCVSFVHRPEDLREVHELLFKLGKPDLGIVAKIETRESVMRLPELLMEGLALPNFGVMIARGDLGVELGFEELAFVQEDILSLCESAHVPVIWATQVLETLARTGLPARAEMTDAVAGQRADCIMLNKGPFIVTAVESLSRLLNVADRRRLKKRDLFRDFLVHSRNP